MLKEWYEDFLEIARNKQDFINAHKERFLEAWYAETNIPPSEAMLVQQETTKDGVVTTRFWIERKPK